MVRSKEKMFYQGNLVVLALAWIAGTINLLLVTTVWNFSDISGITFRSLVYGITLGILSISLFGIPTRYNSLPFVKFIKYLWIVLAFLMVIGFITSSTSGSLFDRILTPVSAFYSPVIFYLSAQYILKNSSAKENKKEV